MPDPAHDTVTAPRLPFAVPRIGFGTSALGGMPDTYGYDVDEDRALQTLRALFALDPCLIDTSRLYGMGRSEVRIGQAIAEAGGLPAGAILSTKIDRDVETGRLDAERARRSVEESLRALNLDRVHILHLHDPEHCRDLDEIVRPGGAIDALFAMKDEGLADAVGLAMGNVPLMMDILARRDFDAIITHNRFTLLNREAERVIDHAHSRGTAVFNAAPYSGGVLAKGSDRFTRIAYQEASGEKLTPVRAVEAVCARHGIPVGAAALQFSMRDPRITSTIVGVSKPDRIEQTLGWAAHRISGDAWQELLALPYATDDPEADRDYSPG